MFKNLLMIIYSFGKIGIISLGGGNSMLRLVEYEVVNYRHWISQDEFTRMVGSSFLFPGLTVVKLTALIGYKIAGLLGLFFAVTSLNISGLGLAVFGYQYLTRSTNPTIEKLMIAVQYGALAMLAAASFSIAQTIVAVYPSTRLIILSILFFLALVCLQWSPSWGLIVFLGLSLLLMR